MCTFRRFAPDTYWISTKQTPHPDIPRDALPDRPIALFEITARTLLGRFMLRPDADLKSLALGVIGRAQLLTKTFIFSHHMLSNHYSVIVGVYSCEQLADFSNRVFGQLAIRVNHLRERDQQKFWARRNRAIPMQPEDSVQIERFRYNINNGVKEHLVSHASQWPGIHTADVFCNNNQQTGAWLDGSALRQARRKNRGARAEDYQRHYTVHLAKLPCLEALSDADYAAQICAWADEDAAAAKAEREESRKPPKPAKPGDPVPKYRPIPEPGDPAALTTVDVNVSPGFWCPTSAPLVHCTPDKEPSGKRRKRSEGEDETQRSARLAYRLAYIAYCDALREARARLRAGFDELGVDLSGGLLPTGWSTGARFLHDEDVPFGREGRARPD